MRRAALLGAALLLGAAAPDGKSIALHGTKDGALPCKACHGDHFQGNPSIGAPALAGLPAIETYRSLAAIAMGNKGHNFVMRNIALSLTPAEREAVAKYFAGLKPPKSK